MKQKWFNGLPSLLLLSLSHLLTFTIWVIIYVIFKFDIEYAIAHIGVLELNGQGDRRKIAQNKPKNLT